MSMTSVTKPILFSVDIRRNVPNFYDTFGSDFWPLLQLQTCLPPDHGGQRLWTIPSPGA